MTVLRWYSKDLLDGEYGKLSKEQKKAVKNIYQGCLRQIKLIGNFLDVAHVEAGKMVVYREKGNIEDVVQDVIQELKVFADKANLYLEFERSKEIIPEFSFDHEKVREVVRNLVDNAIKYTKEGGIKISSIYDSKERKVSIVVRDTGIGFNPEESGRLFTKFSRLKGSEVNPWGSGLGLYVCKRLIEVQGGKIWAKSEGRGKGSEFGFTLPVRE